MRASLTGKQQQFMWEFWWKQYGKLMAASHGVPSLIDAIKAIDMGLVTDQEWEEVSKQKPYIKQFNRLDGTTEDVEVSPFDDEFITHFWGKLKPLMNEEQIEKLKKHHNNIR
jgi:hypothetical protein